MDESWEEPNVKHCTWIVSWAFDWLIEERKIAVDRMIRRDT